MDKQTSDLKLVLKLGVQKSEVQPKINNSEYDSQSDDSDKNPDDSEKNNNKSQDMQESVEELEVVYKKTYFQYLKLLND